MRNPINEDGRLLAEMECYEKIAQTPYPSDGRLYCDATFDGWGCWNYTVNGTLAWEHCPTFHADFDPSLWASRECTSDGTWWMVPGTNRTWSDYTTCIDMHGLEGSKRVIYMFVIGYLVSIASLAVSLAIFTSFKQLTCDRTTLHKHLFISYIFCDITWVLYYVTATLDVDVLVHNPVWCQVLHIITQYLVAVNFSWMFCEGLYLHTIIVVAFATGKKLLVSCLVIGWTAPILPTIIYVTIRIAQHQTSECWMHDTRAHWVIVAPIMLTIALNVVFLLNIVRVLVSKLRAIQSSTGGAPTQTRKAVRATLILIPLLGLQYILFPVQPTDPYWRDIYLMTSAFVTSFQGFFVALIFCFFNGEVMAAVRRRWRQHQQMKRRHLPISLSRRSTIFASTVYSAGDEETRMPQHNCELLPLHVSHLATTPRDSSRSIANTTGGGSRVTFAGVINSPSDNDDDK